MDGKLPPLQASGPLKPQRGGLDLSRVDWDLHDELALAILDAQQQTEAVNLMSRLKQLILQHEIAWTYCKVTLGELLPPPPRQSRMNHMDGIYFLKNM